MGSLMRFARILIAMVCLAVAPSAFAQSSIINSGAVTPGHAPMYVQGGVGSQVVATDSGPAGGGNIGLGLSELLLTARGTGTPPYIGQGSGPLGTNLCDYDAPITNATGYHYLCWGPNPGQLVFGFGGAASANPFSFIINGATYTFPASGVGGNIATYTSPTTANAFPCWSNSVGLLADCSVSAATLVGNPSASNGKAGAFTIQSLPQRASIDANNDKVLLYNNSTGAFNYVTPAQIAVSQTAGVASLGGVTGDITLGTGLQMSGQQLQSVTGGSNNQILWNNAGAQAGFTASGDVSITPSTGATTIQPGVVNSSKIAAGGVADSNLAAGPANSMKGSLNGTTTSDITLVACSAAYEFTQWVTGTGWQCGVSPVLPSRAVAATMNLAAFSAITTQGYASPGDGGGATFKKLTSGNFIDSSVTIGACGSGGGCTVSNVGGGCTPGTYPAITYTGGTGTGLTTTVVIGGGGTATSITVHGRGGNAYSVGDVLTSVGVTSCTTAPAITISSVTVPLGSFSDTNSDKFQLIVDQGNFPNANQFGAVGDWTHAGGDASATNNFSSIQNLLQYAGYNTGGTTSDAGGSQGTSVIIPKGTYKVCVGSGTLLVPSSVALGGVGPGNAILKMCDSDPPSSHFVTLGDPVSHIACFYTSIRDIELFTGSGTANSNIAMIYTNCAQQLYAVHHVSVYAGQRNCLFADTGYGGAANFNVDDFFCTLPGAFTATNNGINMTYGAAVANFHNIIVESGGTSQNGIFINTGGVVNIDGWHSEGVATPIFVDIATSTLARIHNVTGGGGGFCTSLVTRQNSSISGVTVVGALNPNGCTNTINNGGTVTTGLVIGDTTI
jgi:hypothetical protein